MQLQVETKGYSVTCETANRKVCFEGKRGRHCPTNGCHELPAGGASCQLSKCWMSGQAGLSWESICRVQCYGSAGCPDRKLQFPSGRPDGHPRGRGGEHGVEGDTANIQRNMAARNPASFLLEAPIGCFETPSDAGNGNINVPGFPLKTFCGVQ
jgi:hypothetical protein